MTLIDTHAHIYLPEFRDDQDQMIRRAKDAGIDKIFMPNIDLPSLPPMMALQKKYPGLLFPMIGLHPSSVQEDYRDLLQEMKRRLDSGRFIAIGETGIDLYWDKTYREQQISAFRTQITWCLEYNLPIVIHARESFDEIFSVLEEFRGEPLTGVFHSFTGTAQQASHIIDLGFLLGIGGIVTFKNATIKEAIRDIAPENIIVETDAPYLAPVPHRGKRNEPAFLTHTAAFLARCFHIDETTFARITTDNALTLFTLANQP